MWFDSGAFSAFAVGDSEKPFEAIFELLRDAGGDFEFFHGEVAPDSATQTDSDHREVHVEIERAQARLAEWVDIVAVVPSLQHAVKLAPVAPSDRVTVDRSQWELVVAVGNGGAVQDVLRSCHLREFEGCKAIKGLVDISLAEVNEAATAAAAPEPAQPYEAPVVVATEASAQPYVEDHPVDDAVTYEPADAEVATPEALHDSPDAGQPLNSHYSELWAAALEATQNETGEVPEAESVAPEVYAEPAEPIAVEVSSNGHEEYSPEPFEPDGRDALRALLAEVTSNGDQPPPTVADEPVDGLKDRGPWTSHELASFEQFGGWSEDQAEPAEASSSVAAYETPAAHGDVVADHHGQVEAEAAAEESNEEQAVEEPINRGLLLKFLSSVRN
jgi:hypothetical protein